MSIWLGKGKAQVRAGALRNALHCLRNVFVASPEGKALPCFGLGLALLLSACAPVQDAVSFFGDEDTDRHVQVHLKLLDVPETQPPVVTGFDVELVFEGVVFLAGTTSKRDSVGNARPSAHVTSLSMPLVTTNVETVAAGLDRLYGYDDLGSVVFTAEGAIAGEGANTSSAAEGTTRRWYASRETQGSVHIQYRALLPENPGSLGVGPPIELRAEGNSLSGGAGVFIPEPEFSGETAEDAQDQGLYYSVHWDLSNAADEHAFGLSAAGLQRAVEGPEGEAQTCEGSRCPQFYQSPAQFSRSYLMASLGVTASSAQGDSVRNAKPSEQPIVNYYTAQTERFAPDRYVAGWQGQPSFDAAELMLWGEQLYAVYNDFFEVDNPDTYVVFMRSNDVNPGGGMARGNSFIVTYDENTTKNGLKGTFSHEMFHTFLGGLSEPAGLESSWFSEGMAVYYQNLIPMRTGMREPEAFLDGINRTAVRYYTNSKIDTPNRKVPELFWADTRVRVLPYDRGSLYFAKLNYQLTQATDGEQSLDDVLVYLREREQGGEALTLDIWREALMEFSGETGVAEFEAMLEGAVIELPAGTFGPCFERYTDTFLRYELGFPPEVLTEQPRRIRDLIPGSRAEQAGLREGDIITRPVPQDSVQGNQEATLTFSILRETEAGTEEFDLTYLPRGEEAQAYQWRKVHDFEACYEAR